MGRQARRTVTRLLLPLLPSLFLLLLMTPPVGAATKVRVGPFPIGIERMMSIWLEDEGIYKKVGAKHDVDFEIIYPLDDWVAWAAKQVDLGAHSTIEIVRYQSEEGVKAHFFGKDAKGFVEIHVRKDAPYKTMADIKGKKVGFAGWDTATAQIMEILLKEFSKVDLRKDYQVTISPWGTLPGLLLRGDLEAIGTFMPLVLKPSFEGKSRTLLGTYDREWERLTGYKGGLAITLWVARKDFFDKNPNGIRAMLEAWDTGIKEFYTNTDRMLKRYEKWVGKDLTDAHLKFFADWIRTEKPWFPSAYFTEEEVANEKRFLGLAIKHGFVKGKLEDYDIFRIVKP